MKNKNNISSKTLVLDASIGLQIALYENERCLGYRSTAEGVLESVDALITRLLESAHVELSTIDHFIFCEGPGSVLGIRTINVFLQMIVATSEKTPLISSYQSLALAADHLREAGHSQGYIFTEYKRKSYQGIALDKNSNEIVALSLDDLNTQSAIHFHIKHRSGWELPKEFTEFHYDLKSFPLSSILNVSQKATLPKVFALAPSAYQKWNPAIHRKPS